MFVDVIFLQAAVEYMSMTRRALSASRSHHRLKNKCSKQVTPHMPFSLAAKVESNTAKREKVCRDSKTRWAIMGREGSGPPVPNPYRGFGTSSHEPIRDGKRWDRFPATHIPKSILKNQVEML